MRILLLSPLPPFRGGIAQFGKRLLDSLKERNPDTLGINYLKLYPSLLFPGRTQLEEGANPPNGLLHGYDPLAWIRARKAISNLKPDWVISQWWHPFFAPCLMRSVPPNVRRAAVCHNLLPHEGFPLAGRMAASFLMKQDVLALHSRPAIQEARAFPGKKVHLFHPLYDQYLGTGLDRESARKALGLQENHVALLFFGLVRDYKGLDILIEACEKLPENFRILAAGEDYTGRLHSSDRMIREDRFIPDSEVGTWFNAADIVVLPYRAATQSGIAQISLAFGKPMVVTPVGGLPETVEDGVTGAVAGDVSAEGLSEAITRCSELLGNSSTVPAIVRRAGQFSWDTYADRLLEALE